MMQMDYNEDIQAGNFEIEEESREVERAIKQKDESTRSNASKKLSKLVTAAF